MGIELKFQDVAWNSVAISQSTDGAGGELQPSTPGSIACICAPVQGNGEQERDGRKYTIKSIYFSGAVTTTPIEAATDVSDVAGYFFAMVLDTQCNGATIVSEQVYLNPGTSTAAILPYPLRNLENSKRFRILDSVYIPPGSAYSSTDGTNTTSISNQVVPTVKLSWKGNIEVNNVGTTAAVASIADNAVHIVAFAGATGLTPLFQGKCRTRFYG